MRELLEGQYVEIQGSASRPYILKNVGGVFSCSCPGWRFQSLPIERRTCRHLRDLRGEAAEEERVGSILSSSKPLKTLVKAPSLLLAESWDGELDPSGYLLSEKLDGVRAYWDGTVFKSRNGHRFYAPAWFTAGLPLEPLDGELWIDRKKFQRTVSIVRRHDEPDLWKEVRFLVFDAPAEEGPFENRLKLINTIMEINRPSYARAHEHVVCAGHEHLQAELARIEVLSGEGLMLRQPGSAYVTGRSSTLLKVKRFHDAEARVIGHEPGAGKHRGRLGALLVEMADGTRFAVGTGFTDKERESPVPIGATITFKYQELSDGGVPRFPSYLRIHGEARKARLFQEGDTNMSTTATTRRFEFVEGSSDKFYEVSTNDNQVVIRFGRNGTNGQTETKTFSDATAASKHAQRKIDEKVRKGYVEVK